MNIKISLLITLAALGSSINAENNNKSKTPIRDRLARAYQDEINKTTYPAKKANKAGDYILFGSNFTTRSTLLSQMITCMDQLDINESMSANVCLMFLREQLNNPSQRYENQQEKEIALQELTRIRDKDLRQSWFWWM